MLNILKKELWAYFGSYTLYIIALFFILVNSLFLWFFDTDFNILQGEEASLNSFFSVAPWILLFTLPAITMRQFAEEKQMGTLDWLLTQPVSLFDIIIGKFLSVVVVVIFLLSNTIIFAETIAYFSLSGVDSGILLSSYLGLIFLSVLFTAAGIMASTLFSHQVLAYIMAVIINFILFFGLQGIASYNLLGSLDYTLQQWGALYHYNGFLKGLIDTRDIFYFIGTTIICLLLSYISLLNLKK